MESLYFTLTTSTRTQRFCLSRISYSKISQTSSKWLYFVESVKEMYKMHPKYCTKFNCCKNLIFFVFYICITLFAFWFFFLIIVRKLILTAARGTQKPFWVYKCSDSQPFCVGCANTTHRVPMCSFIIN